MQSALHCIALYSVMHCIALYSVMHCIALYSVMHCIALYSAMQCIALHCMTLHCLQKRFPDDLIYCGVYFAEDLSNHTTIAPLVTAQPTVTPELSNHNSYTQVVKNEPRMLRSQCNASVKAPKIEFLVQTTSPRKRTLSSIHASQDTIVVEGMQTGCSIIHTASSAIVIMAQCTINDF